MRLNLLDLRVGLLHHQSQPIWSGRANKLGEIVRVRCVSDKNWRGWICWQHQIKIRWHGAAMFLGSREQEFDVHLKGMGSGGKEGKGWN